MKKILMILTKERRDCVDISLALHERGGSFEVFDQVVFLLNDVKPAHMRYIDTWIEQHPGIACDKIIGDGSRPKGIADMQNRCIEKYPGCFYAKTDEDVFPPLGWARRMWEAYEAHREYDNLALITPLLPNNSYGLYILLNHFYPEYLEEYRQHFGQDPEPQRDSPTWHSPSIAEWATRKFIDLSKANAEQARRLASMDNERWTMDDGRRVIVPIKWTKDHEQPTLDGTSTSDSSPIAPSSSPIASRLSPIAYHLFNIPFSIGCIGYDYRHVERMGGIPWNDEPGWCQWIEDNNQVNVLDCRQIALHYTFFVQQEWLDRSSLLEDIRRENLPDTLSLPDRLQFRRAQRMVRQLPAITRRRFGKSTG